jgi:hypothetical protein
VKSYPGGGGGGTPFLGGLTICYKPPVFQPPKMFGFDFHIFTRYDDFYSKSIGSRENF